MNKQRWVKGVKALIVGGSLLMGQAAVAGDDLIEMMIRVAEGEQLPSQDSIVLKGHSIECRITA